MNRHEWFAMHPNGVFTTSMILKDRPILGVIITPEGAYTVYETYPHVLEEEASLPSLFKEERLQAKIEESGRRYGSHGTYDSWSA